MTAHAFSRILVAVDDSPAALAAVRTAIGLGDLSGARLRFVHILGDGELVRSLARMGHDGELALRRSKAAEALLRHVGAQADRAGVPADTACREGEPAGLLLAEAREWGADLVVIGRSDVRGAGQASVGAVTRQLLEFTEIPVLVVPRPG